ncbi:hypothetical protein D3C85_1871380 [compost metagenome]
MLVQLVHIPIRMLVKYWIIHSGNSNIAITKRNQLVLIAEYVYAKPQHLPLQFLVATG